MFGGQFGWDSEAGVSPDAGEEDLSDISSLAGPARNMAAQVGWGRFLYALVTCVDKNPRQSAGWLIPNSPKCAAARVWHVKGRRESSSND